MKIAKSALSLFLVIVFALTLFSCADTGEDNTVETTTASVGNTSDTEPQETANPYDVKTDLPDGLDFGGTEVRILSRDSDWVKDEITVSSQNGEIINDSIFIRNSKVEETLGLRIVNTMITGGNYVVTEEIRRLVLAGTDEYDILANSCYSTIMYTGENLFRDIKEVEYLDLDKIYWSQGFNEVASFGSKQYFCTGAEALTLYRYMFVTMFNKSLLADHDVGNLYEVVNNGEWTIDYQYELTNKIYDDLNGDGSKDMNDKFGFISGPVAYVDPYWSSCKLPILTKTADNRYQYSLDIERMTNAVDKILRLYYSEGSYIYASVSDAQDQANIAGHLSMGRAATATLRLVSVESEQLRSMKDPYGIIPMPKLDAAQEEYRTFVHDQFTVFGIPSTTPDTRLPVIGAFLELSAAESYRTVVPSYYEIALKGKYLHDDESAQMLDLIYRSVYIDAGVIYTKSLSSVHQKLRTIIKGQTNSTAATFKSLNKIIEKQLDGLMNEFDKLN